MHQVRLGQKWDGFNMNEIPAKPQFPCDYVRNVYCKRVVTSTAKSKRVFFIISNCTLKIKIDVQCGLCS